MKAAIQIAPWRDQVARPGQPSDVRYRVAGLLVAVGFPTLFWLAALALLTKSLGIAMSAAGFGVIGLVIAAICFVGSALIMSESR